MSKQTKFSLVEPKIDRVRPRQGHPNPPSCSNSPSANFWNFMTQQQQQQTTTNKIAAPQPPPQLINFPYLINAPTSLANLAKMSGISLVPVTNQQQQHSAGFIDPQKQPTLTHNDLQYRRRPGNSNVIPGRQPPIAPSVPIIQNIIPNNEPFIPNIPAPVFDPFNLDMGNFSLMKIMAILNNPALTITAVGETSADASLSASSTGDQNKEELLVDPINIQHPECSISVVKPNLRELAPMVKRKESPTSIIATYNSKKIPKEPLQTAKNRLYIPRQDDHTNKKRRLTKDTDDSCLHAIQIRDEQDREVPLSERHLMLESMMLRNEGVQRKVDTYEPDDIFVDRSKRIMSKIDSELEKRKRKRFERISGRATTTCQHRDQADDIDSEFSDEENLEISRFIPIQLPLKEELTKYKREHLISVGLVSRDEKNKIEIARCEQKLKVVCPSILENLVGDLLSDAKRLVATLLKTGGQDIQLRTESSIKRSELPLIEGLNRNSSRMKMSFMNSLGLEKRSKRTTLYKVRNGQENVSLLPVQHQNQHEQQNHYQRQIDLSMQLKDLEKKSQNVGTLKPDYKRPVMSANYLVKGPKRALMSCREALKAPSKDEYMKSLGLMAS